MEGKLSGFSLNRDGTQNITITIDGDFGKQYDELKNGLVTFEVKKAHKRRSLSANAYAWVLIDKIAEKTGIRKSDVYREAIREIGGVSTTVCVMNKAVTQLCTSWARNGLGWQTEILESKIDGCANVVLYFGSSSFDSAQMARFIDLLVQDAEAVGVATISKEEEERMIRAWRA